LITGFHAYQFDLFAKWQKANQSAGTSGPVAHIADALADKDNPIRERTSGFGLEYDLTGDVGPGLPVPSVFFIPDKQQITSHTEICRYIESLLSTCLRSAGSAALSTNTRNLLSALGTKNMVHSVGVMLSRETQALRLQIKDVRAQDLETIFEKAHATSMPPRLKHFIGLSESIRLPALVCLDFAPQLQPTIGLEFNDVNSRSQAVLSEFLDLLVASGLCCTAKRRAIEHWTGTSTPPELPHEWATEHTYANSADCRHFFVAMKRQISHIKIMLDKQAHITAKIYLEFYPETLRLS
jgi:hypothetical protein